MTGASWVGSFIRGARLLKRRILVVGCLRAEERKGWSVRRKETRFRGEPWGGGMVRWVEV